MSGMLRKAIYTVVMLAVALTAAGKEVKKSYYFQRADEAYKQQNYDEVIRFGKLGVEENPKDGYCWALLAEIYSKRSQAQYAEALEAADKALKFIDKKDTEWRAFMIAIKGDVYYKVGDYATAKIAYRQAMMIDKNRIDYPIEYADVCYELGEYEEGVATYEATLDADPSVIYAFVELARGYYYLGRQADAKRACKMAQVLSNDENYASYYLLAKMAAEDGHLSLACRQMARGMNIQGNGSPEGLDTLLYLCKPLMDAAITNETEKSKTDPKTQLFLTGYYNGANHYLPMLYHLHLAERYGQDRKQLLSAYAWAYNCMGESDKAIAMVEEQMASDTASTENAAYYYNFLADVYRGKGQADKALEYSLREHEAAPDKGDCYRMAGRAYIMSGDLDKALVYMDSAVMTVTEYQMPTALFNRGEVYRLMGNEEKAMSDFREAMAYRTTQNDDRSTFVYVDALLGNREAVDHFADSVKNDVRYNKHADYYHLLSAYALLHDKERTLDCIDAYCYNGHRDVNELRNYFRLSWLRDDPDFVALLDKWETVRQAELRKLDQLLAGDEESNAVTELPFTMEGGVYQVKCVINGLPLYFVFDTGAADVTISSVEADFMLKNGYLTDADFMGKQNYVTATGEIHEGTVINLREVRVGDVVLNDVKASVVKSQSAPLLLGQSVFRRFGTLEVDNRNSIIRFKKQ